MTYINPEPKYNESSGGTDFVVHGCSHICYSSDIEGTCVPMCPKLTVDLHAGLVCEGPKFEDW